MSTLREFIDYVKARPGEMNYGSSGVGSMHHLSMEAIKAALQLKMTHIPYRGTGQSVPALLGGHVQVLFSAYPSLAGAVESKKVKLLAQNGEGRWFQAPDVPRGLRGDAELRSGDHRRLVRARPAFRRRSLDKITAEAIAAANSPAAKKQFARGRHRAGRRQRRGVREGAEARDRQGQRGGEERRHRAAVRTRQEDGLKASA